jgi:predicted ATPase/tetratricopeptide (TPR) repeat protein
MAQFEGHASLQDTWVFPSAAAAVVAADELFRLGKDEVIAVVITGEISASGVARGVLSERAHNACDVIRRPGVYACSITHSIAEGALPPSMWFVGVGQVEIESGGVEQLSMLCQGADKPEVSDVCGRGMRIPKPLASFHGRDKQVEEIGDLIFDRFVVSIIGLPGVGKSAFAAAAANSLVDTYEDGIFWIDCGVRNSKSEILHALQEATSPGRVRLTAPLYVIADRLKSMSALIVFDNCESLIEEVREITAALTADTTELGILLTSTVPLQLPMEHIFALGPLSMPLPGSEVAALMKPDSDALVLFSVRARAVHADFELTVDNVEMVSDICRSLGGNPLAIEIFASKLGSRSLSTLIKQLPKSLSMRNDKALRPHHKTLGLALGHALQCISEEHKELLFKLTLFCGGFSFDQASEVWEGTLPPLSLSDHLDFLVRTSLLGYDPLSGLYSVAPLLRAYLGEHHGSSRSAREARIAFCSFMFDKAEAAKKLFDEHDETAAASLLDPYQHEIDAALQISHYIPELHPRFNGALLALPPYWQCRNRVKDLDELLGDALDTVEMNPGQRATCLNLIGAAHLHHFAYDKAEACFLESTRLLQESGTTSRLYAAYGNLAFICKSRGDFEKSIEYNALALEVARSEGQNIRIVAILLNAADAILGWLESSAPLEKREDLFDRCDVLADEAESRLAGANEPFWTQTLYYERGLAAVLRKNIEQAEYFYTLAALTCEAAQLSYEAIEALWRLGEIEIMRGHYERAAKLVGCGIAIQTDSKRTQSDADHKRVKAMIEKIADSLGRDLTDEYLHYGASLAICDLCVLEQVTEQNTQ